MDDAETLDLLPVAAVGDGLGTVLVTVAGVHMTPQQAAKFAQRIFSLAARAAVDSLPAAGRG